MPQWYTRIWPWIFAGLIAWSLYRRFRRNFGRQPLRPARMGMRMVLLILVAISLMPAALRDGGYSMAGLTGTAAGIALALWGASRTRFVRDGERLFYIPHSYTGLAVSALVFGRIVYRLVELYSAGGFPALDMQSADGARAMVQTPLTLGLLFVLIGYYGCYYSRVLWKSTRITPADIEESPPPEGGAPDASHLAR
jgi:hypothetical protein